MDHPNAARAVFATPIGRPIARTPGPSDVRRLEHALARRLGKNVLLKLTRNRRHLVTGRVREGILRAHVHIVFLQAPDTVLDAVACFLEGGKDAAQATEMIDAFLAEHRALLDQARSHALHPAAQGTIHDLQRISEELNAHFFDRRLMVKMTWSRATRGRRRRSMQLGSFSPEEGLIRIHPALDQAFVPEYFVSCVIFHEMLHVVHGVSPGEGRQKVHSPAFMADERRHPDHIRARNWEKKNLKRLLRY